MLICCLWISFHFQIQSSQDQVADESQADSVAPEQTQKVEEVKEDCEKEDHDSDEHFGKRITEDMDNETKQKILDARAERKRKQSREWHGKYDSKGVPWFKFECFCFYVYICFQRGILKNRL